MKNTTLQRSALLSISCLLASGGLAIAKNRSITEFSESDNKRLDWKVVDDGVMGGLSEGKLAISDDGVLKFSGKLSLENNGGFSSIRTRTVDLDLADSAGLVARVRGDGRTYQMRLGSDARYRGMEVSFMAEFETEKGKWTEVKVPFGDLVGSFRGRSLPDEDFNPAVVRRLGLLLADKKAGDFKLEVDWIRAYSAGGDGGEKNVVETAVADGRFETLAAALGAAGLADLLQSDGPFTVFAPTDEAFAKLPEGTVGSLLRKESRGKLQAVLKYHVVPGKVRLADALAARSAETANGAAVEIAFAEGKVHVNESAILDADIETSNGIIHVIDQVLLPETKKPEAATDLLGVAESAGKFGTLLAAVEAAGLTSTLRGDGSFTILAPTDDAFAALPEGTVESLLEKGNRGRLQSILTFHAIGGKVSAGDALNAKSAETVNGQKVEFAVKDGRLTVNGATIVSTDIECDNGIIHVIDAVLIPQGKAGASTDPLELIEAAIGRGVPAYNHGDAAKCAKIYKTCLKQLVDNEGIGGELRDSLQKVLDLSSKADGDRELAWLYRHGLDHAYETLSE